jgi:hypothetical protein
MKRFTVAATLVLSVALLVGPLTGNATAACTVGQSTAFDNPADAKGNSEVASDAQLAQSFKVPGAITLNKVSLYLRNADTTTDSVTVEIHSDTGGQPGALLGAARTRNLTNASYVFADFDFSADNIALAPGTTYYIIATNPSPSFKGYEWGVDASSTTYPDGMAFFRSSSGTSWSTAASSDLLFRVFGQSCTADTQQQQITVPALATVSGLAFSNTTFAAESSGPSATNARKKAHRGTQVSFRLNVAASVRFTVTQRLKGRKVKHGKKTVCAKPTKKNRKRKSCTRVVTLKGSFTRIGGAGKNSFHFTGRLNGRKLKPGNYRLVATPTAGGKTGKSTSSGFRIVR